MDVKCSRCDAETEKKVKKCKVVGGRDGRIQEERAGVNDWNVAVVSKCEM